MLHLDYRDARPIYTQITDGIREQILGGILREGDKLPSVRDLATQLTINPNTIQRSYRELEMQGWIASIPGKGSYVCGIPGSAREEQAGLFAEFDKITRQLLAIGVSRQELADRLNQGGK